MNGYTNRPRYKLMNKNLYFKSILIIGILFLFFINIEDKKRVPTPTEYIQNIGLICKDGYRVQFKGKEIKEFPGDDLVEGLINFVEDNGQLPSPVIDVEIIIDYAKLEKDVSKKTNELLKDK